MNKYNNFVIEEYQRLDIRYYYVKINGQYFLMDYSNPKDIRNYVPGLFKKELSEWLLYPVDDIEGMIPKIVPPLTPHDPNKNRRNVRKYTMYYVLFWLYLVYMPEPFNISYWTYDPNIIKYWPLFFLGVLVGVFIIILILRLKGSRYSISKSAKYKLSIVNDSSSSKLQKQTPVSVWLCSMIGLIFMCALIGISPSNYAAFFVFYALQMFNIFFEKFYYFAPFYAKQKYTLSATNQSYSND